MRTPVLAIGILIALNVTDAAAQTCLAAPSFRDRPMQVGGGLASVNREVRIDGMFLVGGERLFGGGGMSFIDPQGVSSTSTNALGIIGAEFRSVDHPVFTCPLALVRAGNGPDLGLFDSSSVNAQLGLSVGVELLDNRETILVPTFALAVVYNRIRTEFLGARESSSQTYGHATLGIGFVFDRRFAVVPAFQIPLGAASSDAGFSWTLAWSFGGR